MRSTPCRPLLINYPAFVVNIQMELMFVGFEVITVDLAFWQEFINRKSREWKLDVKRAEIKGFFEGGRTLRNSLPSRFQIVPSDRLAEDGRVYQKGFLHVYETLSKLREAGDAPQGLTYEHPFELHVFGDLKHYKFHYRFFYLSSPIKASSISSQNYEVEITVVDPCSRDGELGLPVANEIHNRIHTYPSVVKLIIQRQAESKVLFVKVEATSTNLQSFISTELKAADLSAALDPEKLSEEAARLNLNLMTWRMVPGLDLDIISNKRYLILGSGTLGCNILRGLIVRHTS